MISNAVLLQLNRGSRTFVGDKHVPIRNLYPYSDGRFELRVYTHRNSKTVYYRGRITCFIGRRYPFCPKRQVHR